MESKYRFYLTKFLKFFGQGLLFVAPIGITVYVLYLIFNKLDNIFQVGIPGLGIIIIIAGVTIIGYFGPKLITNPVFSYFNKTINRTPIVKIIYTSIRDLLSAFVGNKKKFTEPVLIKMSKDSEIEQLGFLTQKDLAFMGIEGKKVSVYIPFAYGFMGSVLIVPEANVTPISASPTETMKFIISGGVTQSNQSEQEEEQSKTESENSNSL